MTVDVGDRLPAATLMRMGPDGPETVEPGPILAGRKVVIFAVPAPYSTTCHTAHVPSYIRVMDGLRGKGVDEVICISVSDPFVVAAWGEVTGATAAGIAMLADPGGAFTEALGMIFDAPPVGLFGRSRRHALAAEDGVVTIWHPEPARGCAVSGGEAMLAALWVFCPGQQRAAEFCPAAWPSGFAPSAVAPQRHRQRPRSAAGVCVLCSLRPSQIAATTDSIRSLT